MFSKFMPWIPASVVTDIDRKSLLTFRGVGLESEAENVRFHGRRVTKVGPEVKGATAEAGGR